MSVYQRIRGRDEHGTPLREKTFTVKIEWQGKQKAIATGATDRKAALKLESEIKRELKAGRIPDLLNKLKARADRTTANLVAGYIAAGCPDSTLRPRADRAGETARLQLAVQWWGNKNPDTICKGDSLAYLAWRQETHTREGFTGERAAERELQSLSNCLNWAHGAGHLKIKPPLQTKLQDPKTVRHAREVMPASATEAHRILGAMFQPVIIRKRDGTQLENHEREVNAWLGCFLYLTGLRTGEARLLRTDAQGGLKPQPGFINGNRLHVHREKGGCKPWIQLDDPARPHIRPLLEKILQWKAVRYPDSPWLFPGRNGGQLEKRSFGRALDRCCARLKLDLRTPHGFRALYASCRLAAGEDPDDVARELGQRSGDDLVRDVYGIDPDDFIAETFTALKDTFTWLPAGTAAAWDLWNAPATNIIPLASA